MSTHLRLVKSLLFLVTIMSNKFCFLVMVFLFLLTSCSSPNNESSSEEVIFDDGYKTPTNGEVIIDDSSFKDKEAVITASSLHTGSREITQIAGDGSQIEILKINTADAIDNNRGLG